MLQNNPKQTSYKVFVAILKPKSITAALQSRHDLRCAIASCELRCVVASCDVRVRTHFVETCDVRACGAFLGVRSAINTLQIFKQ